MNRGGWAMTAELLLEHRQVGHMVLRYGNPLGHDYRGASVERLKEQRHSRRWVARGSRFQQVLAGKYPGCKCPVAEDAFIPKPGVGRSRQQPPIAAVKVGVLEPISRPNQQHHKARQTADDYRVLLQAFAGE